MTNILSVGNLITTLLSHTLLPIFQNKNIAPKIAANEQVFNSTRALFYIRENINHIRRIVSCRLVFRRQLSFFKRSLLPEKMVENLSLSHYCYMQYSLSR